MARLTNEPNMLNMIESRIIELLKAEQESKRKLPKLFSQRLPRHMRRRAACHDPKRLPKRLRRYVEAADTRKKLLIYRLKKRHTKNKRILKKHLGHHFKDGSKCLLHKWFAKRFKMEHFGILKNLPLHNSTKNQLNLYRQSLYGCAYISMAHLVRIRLDFNQGVRGQIISLLDQLNSLTNCISGFTFSAEALELGEFEITVKLFSPAKEFICNALVFLSNYSKCCPSYLTMWLPKENSVEILRRLEEISELSKVKFRCSLQSTSDILRIRLLGPNSHLRALSISTNLHENTKARDQVVTQIHKSLGLSIGRFIEEDNLDVIHYNTDPITVDIVLKGPSGRLLWCKLVKNKAHLVGGYRDWLVLSKSIRFKLE